jgi:predicted amidohydrolase YtcJ
VSPGAEGPAELVVVGRIATLAGLGDDLGLVEAVAIRDGRLIAAGRLADVDAACGPRTRRTELAPDEVALPGLTDAHVHLADAAVAATELRLESTASLDEALGSIRAANAAIADEEGWLLGGGWDAGRWGGWPTTADLESAAPGRRIVLWSHDLHAVWASEAALASAGIADATTDPPGGLIRRTADGRPAGVLHEDATGLVTAGIPRPGGARLAELIAGYARHLLSLGVVAVHDMAELEVDAELGRGFAAIERLAAGGRLPIRVRAGIRRAALERAIERGLRSGDPLGDTERPDRTRARVGWLKLFADGTLGSRTAALLTPYETEIGRDEPPGGPLGILVTEPGDLRDAATTAAAAGIGTTIHAIGDRALRVAIDALEPTAALTAVRPRIEHLQLADPADIPRLARAGIAVSIQPVHLADDAPKARLAWGDRIGDSYPWRRLVGLGVTVASGSDAPAATDYPWPGLAMAVTRRDPGWPDGSTPYVAGEALTLGEALRAACIGGPVSAGEVDRGRLGVGQRADLIVVPAAGLSDPAALRTTRPRLVLLDGEVAFEA